MDLPKLYRLEAEFEMLANARRARGESYRARIEASKALRNDAVARSHGDYQSMALPDLLKLTPNELADARVEERTLQRAAVERNLADGLLRGTPHDEAHFVSLSNLLTNLRAYTGVF